MTKLQNLKTHIVDSWHLRFSKSGMTQTEIAYKAGVNPSTLSLIMNSHSVPHASTVEKIEDVLREGSG